MGNPAAAMFIPYAEDTRYGTTFDRSWVVDLNTGERTYPYTHNADGTQNMNHRTDDYRAWYEEGYQAGRQTPTPKKKEPEVPKTDFEIAGDLLDAIDDAKDGLADCVRALNLGILYLIAAFVMITGGWVTTVVFSAGGYALALLILGGLTLIASGWTLANLTCDTKNRAYWRRQLRRATREYDRHLTKDM